MLHAHPLPSLGAGPQAADLVLLPPPDKKYTRGRNKDHRNTVSCPRNGNNARHIERCCRGGQSPTSWPTPVPVPYRIPRRFPLRKEGAPSHRRSSARTWPGSGGACTDAGASLPGNHRPGYTRPSHRAVSPRRGGGHRCSNCPDCSSPSNYKMSSSCFLLAPFYPQLGDQPFHHLVCRLCQKKYPAPGGVLLTSGISATMSEPGLPLVLVTVGVPPCRGLFYSACNVQRIHYTPGTPKVNPQFLRVSYGFP